MVAAKPDKSPREELAEIAQRAKRGKASPRLEKLAAELRDEIERGDV